MEMHVLLSAKLEQVVRGIRQRFDSIGENQVKALIERTETCRRTFLD